MLFGATGYTGRIVAEYLLERAPKGLRWAIAGRSAARLEATRAELSRAVPAALELSVLVADAADRRALDRIATATRAIATTVGPYARHGAPLVAACAAAGTHYCDLTGEVPFMRRMIDEHHEEARASGARIVFACGFDSIPSDLGCAMITAALEEAGARPRSVRMVVGPVRGGVSGGTAASLLEVLESASTPAMKRLLADPYALDPENSPRGKDKDQLAPRVERALGIWTGPFVMAPVNTRVVRRTHALLGHPYGDQFSYSEAVGTGRGALGLLKALALGAGLGGALLLLSAKPIRRAVAARLLPKAGEGPTKEQRARGFFRCALIADGETPSGERRCLQGEIRGVQDPGYGETAKMLGETAIALAKDESPGAGGCTTPAAALGMRLIERLRAAGMVFSVTGDVS